jgi:hypothetical protein
VVHLPVTSADHVEEISALYVLNPESRVHHIKNAPFVVAMSYRVNQNKSWLPV